MTMSRLLSACRYIFHLTHPCYIDMEMIEPQLCFNEEQKPAEMVHVRPYSDITINTREANV